LIGEKVKDDTFLKGGGVEIITSAATHDYTSHALYPQYSDKFEDGLFGAHVTYPVLTRNADRPEEGLLGAHATYPLFVRTSEGLIGEKFKDEILVKGGGLEPLASFDAHGRRPEEGLLGANIAQPKFETTSGGLIGKEFKNDSMIEDGPRCITANKASIAHGPACVKLGCAEVVSEVVPDDCQVHPLTGTGVSRVATDTGTLLPSKLPADLELDLSYSLALKNVEDNKQVALLVAAFVSLPCEAIIHAMRAATTPIVTNSGSPMKTCIG
jgi:hypothetical protein